MHGSIKVLVLWLCTVEEGKKEVEPLLFSKKYPILGSNSTIPMCFPILRGVIEVTFFKILSGNGHFCNFCVCSDTTKQNVMKTAPGSHFFEKSEFNDPP